ncbi:alpha/beta hydrolase [Nocardiopsis aegyptia]|uniref:alpha/beta hydrolase n=1 Tax=Nocardiopsis aegyptia TaxID=220378 RepID=UPI00366E7ED8
MDASALHPDLRSAFRRVPNPPIARGWQRSLVRLGTRLLPRPRLRDGLGHEYVALAPGVGAHVFTPAGGGSGAALLWIHGGGMVIGTAAQDHASCVDTAVDLDIVVVSVEYRLAPEHPFPVPLDDCFRVWSWLLDHAAERGVDPRRIAVGGQSAGGGLAAGLVQRIHDHSGVQPAAQWLFCPMLDDRTAARRELDAVDHFLWNNRSNRVGWSAYLGTEPGAPHTPPYAAPGRRTDLGGMPPTWIGAGDIELFHDEDRAYAEALTGAGVDTTLVVVPGAPHAFESLAPRTRVAEEFGAAARTWLRGHLAPPE